jgi:hypothetical protein
MCLSRHCGQTIHRVENDAIVKGFHGLGYRVVLEIGLEVRIAKSAADWLPVAQFVFVVAVKCGGIEDDGAIRPQVDRGVSPPRVVLKGQDEYSSVRLANSPHVAVEQRGFDRIRSLLKWTEQCGNDSFKYRGDCRDELRLWAVYFDIQVEHVAKAIGEEYLPRILPVNPLGRRAIASHHVEPKFPGWADALAM